MERSFAHVCDTGGARRSWPCGLIDVTKRYLMAVAAHNLGRIMRKLFGMDKPRTLQKEASLAELVQLLVAWLRALCPHFTNACATLGWPSVRRPAA